MLTFVWGIVATLQGVIVNNGGNSGLAGFFVIRFFLGLTEGMSSALHDSERMILPALGSRC